MASGISVEISDDYAVLRTKIGTFYFGYESAREEDEFEWRFTFTDKNGQERVSLTMSELGCAEELSYDDAAAIVLYGVGYCIEHGIIEPTEV